MQRGKILIVEDEKLIRWTLRGSLTKNGYTVIELDRGKGAAEMVKEENCDLVLLDYRLPDINGIEVLKRIIAFDKEIPVIIMTAFSTVESAITAMKLGAYDYINKPVEMEELLVVIQKALETTALRREVSRLRREQMEKYGLSQIIGKTKKMTEVFEMIKKITGSRASNILITGESGTGKDLIAKAIHYSSGRAKNPFMNITCSALPENLLESELFGYDKGAFTDAKGSKKGLLELAGGGTAFLNEIGDMGLSLQAKILRFLEERTFKRVGGTKDITVDVMIIASTNSNLEEGIAKGTFRPDLYYRLKVIPIELPPLRDRKEDISLLIDYFIDYYNIEFRKKTLGMTDRARTLLMEKEWPGNVRELRNIIERIMILENKETIDIDDLPKDYLGLKSEIPKTIRLPDEGINLENVEKDLIQQAVERCNGNQTKAANLLGISRDTLRYRLKKIK